MFGLPTFDIGEVQPLASAVNTAPEHLRKANELLGDHETDDRNASAIRGHSPEAGGYRKNHRRRVGLSPDVTQKVKTLLAVS
jgi:hypothetical protein